MAGLFSLRPVPKIPTGFKSFSPALTVRAGQARIALAHWFTFMKTAALVEHFRGAALCHRLRPRVTFRGAPAAGVSFSASHRKPRPPNFPELKMVCRIVQARRHTASSPSRSDHRKLASYEVAGNLPQESCVLKRRRIPPSFQDASLCHRNPAPRAGLISGVGPRQKLFPSETSHFVAG